MFKLLGAVAVLSAAIVTPVTAQQLGERRRRVMLRARWRHRRETRPVVSARPAGLVCELSLAAGDGSPASSRALLTSDVNATGSAI
jgi:hypothetical protein